MKHDLHQGRAFQKSHEEVQSCTAQMKYTLDKNVELNHELVHARARIAALVLQLQSQSQTLAKAEENLAAMTIAHDGVKKKCARLEKKLGILPSCPTSAERDAEPLEIRATVGHAVVNSPWVASFKREDAISAASLSLHLPVLNIDFIWSPHHALTVICR